MFAYLASLRTSGLDLRKITIVSPGAALRVPVNTPHMVS